jgi:flagellar hook capping protein FlgD/VCBS repeat protein
MTWRGAFLLVPFVLLVLPASARASACFSNTSAPLTGVDISATAWGDYDNDGDLDLVVAGLAPNPDGEYVTRLYRNDAGTFHDIGVGIPGYAQGSAAWGDYDNDGDLDLLISGILCSYASTRIYRNSGGTNPTFHNAYAGLPGIADGSVAWGDYDNDGDLDFAICGQDGTFTEKSFIFRSSGGANPTFTNANAGLTALKWGSVSWADYDKDGDLDLLLSGYSSEFGIGDRVFLYVNSGGANPTFSDVGGQLFSGFYSAVDWGDYDNDGDLDLVATGGQSFGVDADIYQQGPSHVFNETFSPLVGVGSGSARFGDYNNDGNLDALLVGGDLNDNGKAVIHQAPAFNDIGAGLAGVGGTGTTTRSSAAWGDYDNDGDLDVALAGLSPTIGEIARVYRNDCGTSNTPPTAPTNLVATVNGNTITFSWSPATDAQTPQAGLTYNLRVGTVPGASNVISPEANLSTGYRRLPAMGNTDVKTSWMLRVPGAGAYYWSVQAIDGSYAGGPFAAEHGTGVTAVEETLTQNALLRVEGPNPLSSAVTIEFNPPQAEHVQIGIYDIAGRLVRSLLNADMPAGSGTRVWDGKDDAGHDVPSGLYLIRLNTLTEERVNKVTVVR